MWCSRGGVILSKEVTNTLPTQFKDRGAAYFSRNVRPKYIRLSGRHVRAEEDLSRYTAGYIFYEPSADPGFLCVFGMSGTTTLLWTTILGNNPAWLRSIIESPFPRVVMAEFPLSVKSDVFPTELANLVPGNEVRVVLDETFPPTTGASPNRQVGIATP